MNGGVGAVQRDLHAVKAGVVQLGAQLRGQQLAVGVQAGDEPLGRVHQLRQIGPEGGLAAGERHLRDIGGLQAAEDIQPLLGGQLRRVGQRLTGGVAMQALLVAVPRAVTVHGADHQIHAVGRGHLGGIFTQREDAHLRLRLPSLGDGHQRGEHQGQIVGQIGLFGKGIGFMGRGHGGVRHGTPVGLADLQTGEGLQPVHEVGQQNGP